MKAIFDFAGADAERVAPGEMKKLLDELREEDARVVYDTRFFVEYFFLRRCNFLAESEGYYKKS